MIERITRNEKRLDNALISIKKMQEALDSFKKIRVVLNWLVSIMEVIIGIKIKIPMKKEVFLKLKLEY